MLTPVPRRRLGVAILFASWIIGFAALADPPPPGVVWLDVGGLDPLPLEQPRNILVPLSKDPEMRFLEVLGEIAFQAPEILGTVARRSGLSCQACHINGTINPNLFIDGVSASKGGLDVTSGLFDPAADDSVFNHHRDVPSLRGIRATPPYGREGKFSTLRGFTEHVIVDEFGGAAPSERLLDALVAYQNRFQFGHDLKNPERRGRGDGAIMRGNALFRRPFEKSPKTSCASCHLPDREFIDGRQHDVGTGGQFDTPTLRGIAESAPYLHDGRAESLAAVVGHFDRFYALNLTAAERGDMVAYLTSLGAREEGRVPVTLNGELQAIDRFREFLGEAIKRRRFDDAALAVYVSRRRIGDLYQRYSREHQELARQAMVVWSRALQSVGNSVEAADATAARFAFLAYTSAFWELGQTVIENAPGARLKVR